MKKTILAICMIVIMWPYFYANAASEVRIDGVLQEVSGPSSSTDNAVTCFDGITGVKLKECTTVINSIVWGASGMSVDGAKCTAPVGVTINSGPIQYSIICADDDASTIYGNIVMPDGWNAGTLTIELEYIQTAADTGSLNSDIAMMCRGAGETVNNTWGSEIALDDAAVTGSNAVDHTTSAAVTADGTCAAGDTLYWRWQMDATGTTTAVATLNIMGVKVEFTTTLGD